MPLLLLKEGKEPNEGHQIDIPAHQLFVPRTTVGRFHSPFSELLVIDPRKIFLYAAVSGGYRNPGRGVGGGVFAFVAVIKTRRTFA